jgi:indolepyruvate ferredoxin oxidoreductase
VARLYSDGEFRRKLERRFEGDFELRFNLAPPLLARRDDATGEPRKREFGPWIMTLFGLLSKLRFLRGSRLDLFGYSAERRRERADIEAYESLLETLEAGLSGERLDLALQLAESPAMLRGFGHVKDRNRDLMIETREALLRQFKGEVEPEPVKIVEAA